MLYFAYGSNMSRGPMQTRCPTAQESGRAVLRGYRFVIMANGYATVVPSTGEDVHGILWRIGSSDLSALDEYEDVAGGLYRHAMLPVLRECDSGQGGKTVTALVYLGCEAREGRPSYPYMALVIEAARDCGLPEHYVAQLARILPE
jgi:gamma-glutamylcyclotransferase (GGCT)/AIG2-like uncharacterized protein YtfP